MKTRIAIGIIAAAASLGASAAASTPGVRGKAVGAQSTRYCAMVEINSRIPRKLCLSQEEWLHQGVTLKRD